MNVYTDPSLLDVAGALETLPDLCLNGAAQAKDARAATYPLMAGPSPRSPDSSHPDAAQC